MTDLSARLRAVVEERLAVARAACHGGEGRWHQTDAEREYGRIEDERGEVVTYDEGSPSGREAEHIALNDPADVILACERDLAVLERHGDDGTSNCETCRAESAEANDYGNYYARYVPWPCVEIRDLATRYRVEVDGG